jgi:hypothetical protein
MRRRMVPLLALMLGLAAGCMPGPGATNRPPVRTAIPHEDDPIPPVGPCQGAHARAKAAERPRRLWIAIPHEDDLNPSVGLPQGAFQERTRPNGRAAPHSNPS